MIRLRRASVIVALSLLTSATTAGAECAWVLWSLASSKKGGGGWSVDGGYATKVECEADKVFADRAFKDGKLPSVEKQVTYCLPDTVDPRGPKGK